MRLFFYPRLALTNIRKNAKTYFPYLMTSTFCVAMYYMIHSLSVNAGYESMKVGRTVLPQIMNLGTWVMIIFSIIFLFYINSFLMKRRKKEVALYNILGMEKKHIMMMMFYETLITTLFSLIVGILFGLLFSKLMFVSLLRLAHLNATFVLSISYESIIQTIILFVPIYFASYLLNALQIHLANPIELLKGGQVGEKEPKIKWFMTLMGIVTLGGGYYLAQTIEDPVEAMVWFFVAVILVIIGTYSLFTAGSITLLKILKKNKRFYYQTRHFTSVSQMIYRMKQNAVGLASICILCTCILVMLSSTVSLYITVQDSSHMMVNENLSYMMFDLENVMSEQEIDQLYQDIQDDFQKQGIETTQIIKKRSYFLSGAYENNNFIPGAYSTSNYSSLTAMNVKDYNKAYNDNARLKDDEVLVACNFKDLEGSIQMNGKTFHIKGQADHPYILSQSYTNIERDMTIIFSSEKVLRDALITEEYQTSAWNKLSIDFKDIEQTNQAIDIITKHLPDNATVSYQSQYAMQIEYLEVFGGLFFLGIFLGLIFLIAAILIMYYKQLSEGYEDQKRYEIMQNVGMSRKEVKQSIHSQVLIFFFLPLIVAIIHMAMAFKMIVKMFSFLVLSDTIVFVICTLIAIIILIIIYTITYSLTARTYYKIVSPKKVR